MAMWLAVATSATITMISFLLLSLIAGSVIALTAGPLGAFVVWRRMAYFGDTLAHSALLGVAFGIVLNISPVIGIVLASSAIALLLWWMQKSTTLANDSLLGILSHSALALGLVCVGLFSNSRIDLYGYLFGDLLTVNMQDIAVVCAAASVILGLVCFLAQPINDSHRRELGKSRRLSGRKIALNANVVNGFVNCHCHEGGRHFINNRAVNYSARCRTQINKLARGHGNLRSLHWCSICVAWVGSLLFFRYCTRAIYRYCQHHRVYYYFGKRCN